MAAWWVMQMAGCRSRSNPYVSSTYGLVGLDTASAGERDLLSLLVSPSFLASLSFFGSFFSAAEPSFLSSPSPPPPAASSFRFWLPTRKYRSNSSQDTSHLPIQNGRTRTLTGGPSSLRRSSSDVGLPISNVP